jgi:hypothetical protein
MNIIMVMGIITIITGRGLRPPMPPFIARLVVS